MKVKNRYFPSHDILRIKITNLFIQFITNFANEDTLYKSNFRNNENYFN